MTENDPPAAGAGHHVNFDAPATFRKWPSLNNQRRTDAGSPYLLVDGTLDECIRQFLAKPPPVRHLYENSHVTTGTIGGRRSVWGDHRRTRSPSRFSLIRRPNAGSSS